MKAFYLTIAIVVVHFALPPAAYAKLKVFACEPEWAALSQELGGDKVKVFSATTAFQDVHRIQARPSLIAKARSADLLICTGAELESGWLPLLTRRAANKRIQNGQPGHFMAAEHVERLDVPAVVDRSMGDVHIAGNPHVHLSPQRILEIATRLSERLMLISPADKAFFKTRSDSFAQRWREAITTWEARAQPLRGKTIVVHHKDWRYLSDWLKMDIVASLEPKPGLPPNAGHLAKLKQQLKQQPAAMILRAQYQDARASKWLSKNTGIPSVVLPYTVGGSDQAQDLFSLYDDTLTKMLNALP